jgi:hypothetical protein
MKFETHYKKSLANINKHSFESEYRYELALYNHFVESLIPITAQQFIKSWRWKVRENAIRSKYDGRIHIKQLLTQVFESNLLGNTVNDLEKAVEEQFIYLDSITSEELSQIEEPFLGVDTCDEGDNFKFEVTLTFGSPNLFLFVDEDGGFRIEGYSPSHSSVNMNGHNKELLNYFNQTIGE